MVARTNPCHLYLNNWLASMSATGFPTTTIEKVAAQLEGDIREKGLRPGDRYLTAAEAGKRFSVSPMTMHRAMQSLADREMLIRQRSRGTFVGPKFRGSNHARQDFNVVHLLMALDSHRTHNHSSDEFVDEFAKTCPGAAIEVHHVLESAASSYVAQLIERADGSQRDGFVLLRCSRDVQRMMCDSGLPTVVYGQAYPGVDLPTVMHDQVAVGRLTAEYALSCGAQRYLLLTHAHWRYGDHQMIDTLTATLAAANVPLDSLKIRSIPPEHEVIKDVVLEAAACTEPPDAILCRSDFVAASVQGMIESSDCFAGRRPCLVSGGHGSAGIAKPFARVVSSMEFPQQIEHVANLLSHEASATGGSKNVCIPVEFVESHGGDQKIGRERRSSS